MRIRLIIFFLAVFPLTSNSQVNAINWGVEDTNLYIIKNTTFGVVHDYLELFNYSGGDLNMRWIRYTPSDWPSGWGCDFTDPSNSYMDVFLVDSGDFVLTDPPGFANKLIIGVDHNGIADTSYQMFKVFPISNPSDTLWITYHILIGNPDSGIELVTTENLSVFPNPANESITIEFNEDVGLVEYKIIDATGKLMLFGTVSDQESIDVSELSRGVYILELDNSFRIRFVKD